LTDLNRNRARLTTSLQPGQGSQAISQGVEIQIMRVLVVDEDSCTCDAACEVLEKLGCEPRGAVGARQAWRALRRARPDAALVSVSLPEMAGSNFVEEWKHDPRCADVPIVVMATTPRAAVDAIRAGARGVIKKPIETAGVVNCLPDVLRGRARDPRRAAAGWRRGVGRARGLPIA
jgi:DNA-binding NtrC family response regulator